MREDGPYCTISGKKFGFDWPSGFREENVLKLWRRRQRLKRQLRRATEHGYTTSSPCKPNGSGELKIRKQCSCIRASD